MAELKDFDVKRILRSDGADSGPGYWPAPAPSAAKKTAKEAPASAPRQKAHMVRLEDDDPRFIEWRIKLGILLKQELALNPDEGNPWYLQFPRGYWLYEKSKHLWVSGYPIKGKLYKTPQEFGLHLLWLMGTSADYHDCCCIHCNVPATKPAVAVETAVPLPMPAAPAAASKNPSIPHKVTPVPLPTFPGQLKPKEPANGSETQKQTQVPIPNPAGAHPGQPPAPSRSQAQLQGQTRSQGQPQTAQLQQPQPQPQSQPQPQMQPQPPPQSQPPSHSQPQSQAQAQSRPPKWSLQSPLLFRSGELVWYQNGNSWRLGVISAPGDDRFEVTPIGHEVVPQQPVEKKAKEMRPFHAFSVPGVSMPELQGKPFDATPWVDIFNYAGQDRGKRNNLLLDASKMAASKIDTSFSFWSPLSQDMQGETVPFYGCFLGAERIELGDCLRVNPVAGDSSMSWNDTSVLGVRRIMLRTVSPQRSIVLIGAIYQVVKADDPYGQPVPIEDLPVPLQEETRWRNAVRPEQPCRWSLVKEDAVLEERNIRGRFYPTHHIMPILNEAAFNAAVAERNFDNQYPYLNNRLDGAGGYVGFCVNRRDALGASVAASTRLRLEPFVREMERGGGNPAATQ
ncbi:hypothetical protein JDV02_007892 [Purpureocillium takamizusanense]|uniref:Cryptic loci regulator 2 C-terminal domain-containing protein n=1 Tax=Purpureocillium takamizusanense TaxID=2060973 RepID=A0A9Q8QJ43_9HYPO|nr:uncharacterized protein JDV02_007892 [Purpureocillium takamizusanense]UNI21954.1 hypothetical protein JDV02_007892 [Purpureocillium takamizusanense]